jgi:hypothetical protein
MRRYAVRFLVAILTFGLGVTLSLVFGLFKPQPREEFNNAVLTVRRTSCGREFRVVRPAFITIDNELSDPVKLVYLGETPERRMQLSIENRRDQAITGYSISAERIWGPDNRRGSANFSWTSNVVMEPGEWRSIELPRDSDGLLLRVSNVTFQSGFTWNNPREER